MAWTVRRYNEKGNLKHSLKKTLFNYNKSIIYWPGQVVIVRFRARQNGLHNYMYPKLMIGAKAMLTCSQEPQPTEYL